MKISRLFFTIQNKQIVYKNRENQAPFMTKELSKAIMKRSRFKNKFNKNPCDENKSMYKKQRNFCSNLLNREKKKII